MNQTSQPLIAKKKLFFTNVIVMSLCFFGIFFAFNTSQAMQTTTNAVMGYINLGCLYGVFTIFSLFGPKIVDMMGPKLAMIIGGASYVIVVFCNIWSTPYIQIPANIIVGMGAALIWNAEGVYLARCALHDCSYNGKTFSDTTSDYNGAFFSIFQFSGFAGTLISGYISTILPDLMYLFIILGSLGTVSVLCLLFLPNVKPQFFSMSKIDPNTIPKTEVSLVETISLLIHDKKLDLTIPVIFYNGMSLAYIFGDIPKNISSQVLGSEWTLYVTAFFYLTNSIASYLFGKLSGLKKFGRRGSFISAFILQSIAYVFLIFYPIPETKTPSALNFVLIFLSVFCLSFGDSVWESQPPAVLQSFYNEDKDRNAAMANYKMWQSLGFCVQFVIGACLAEYNFFWIKTLIIFVGLLIGYGCFLYLDCRIEPIDVTIKNIESKADIVYEA